jgi:hypothetical protein
MDHTMEALLWRVVILEAVAIVVLSVAHLLR